MKMSEILSNVLANASVDFTMRLPSSDRVKCYMKDFVQNADAILNGDSDYFRGLHNIEIETYMKGADYESTYQKSCATCIWLRRHSEDAELCVWAC